MRVNIILPVYNRPIHTRQTINSLYQNTDKRDFSLTVVDDVSNGETKTILRELQEKYKFMMIANEENLGPGESKNIGAEFCQYSGSQARYIYFSDNDVYFMKGWLEALIEVYEKVSTKRVCLLGGGCHPYQKNNDIIDCGDFKVGLKNAVSGYSHFMTWEIWNRFKPYANQFGLDKKTGQSDDWKFCQDIINDGLLVGSIDPEMVIATGKTDTYGDPAVGQETFRNYEGIEII